MFVAVAQPKDEVEEASQRDFSLKPREADDTIIALAISVATVLVVAPLGATINADASITNRASDYATHRFSWSRRRRNLS